MTFAQRQVRLPLAPLLEKSGADRDTSAFDGARQPNPVTMLARMIGVDARTVHRWAHEGVPIHSADHAAIAIGTHPGCVWPDWTAYAFEQDRVEEEDRYDGLCRQWLQKQDREVLRARRELVVGYEQVEKARRRRHLRVVA